MLFAVYVCRVQPSQETMRCDTADENESVVKWVAWTCQRLKSRSRKVVFANFRGNYRVAAKKAESSRNLRRLCLSVARLCFPLVCFGGCCNVPTIAQLQLGGWKR